MNPYLTKNLVCYFPFDEETAGLRLDRSGNGFTGTDVNTVTTQRGSLECGAASVLFVRANAEHIIAPSSPQWNDKTQPPKHVALSVWLNLTVKNVFQLIGGISDGNSADNRRWLLFYNNSTDRLNFQMSNSNVQTNAVANNFGAVPTATWIHVMCWFESGVGGAIRVNNGTPDLNPQTYLDLDVRDRDLVFGTVRRGSNSAVDTAYYDGAMALPTVWNPTTEQLQYLKGPGSAELYNGGKGLILPYA